MATSSSLKGLFGVVLFAMSVHAGAADPTLGQYRLHRATAQTQPQPIDNWVEGYMAAVGYQYTRARLDGKPAPFCPPPKFSFRDDAYDLIDWQLAYYRKQTGRDLGPDTPLGAVIQLAIENRFSCRKS